MNFNFKSIFWFISSCTRLVFNRRFSSGRLQTSNKFKTIYKLATSPKIISSLILLSILCLTSQSYADPLCTIKAETHLKKLPNIKARVSWRVGKYMPLMSTGKESGVYLEVRDIDGDLHWVSRRDVSRQANCVVVKTSVAKLKTGPGRSYENSPLGLVDKYTPFLDIGGEDGWTQIKDDSGITSWIQIDQLWRVRKKVRMSFDKS